MEGQAVTTNPWLIMAINMTVVFVVLILLGVLMEIVHLVDPTKKKKEVHKTETTVALWRWGTHLNKLHLSDLQQPVLNGAWKVA